AGRDAARASGGVRDGGGGDDAAPGLREDAGSAAGDGSAAPRNTGGVGAKRAVAIERTARAPPRPAAAGVDVAALLAAASGTALSVRSMKSARSSVSPLTASRTASRTPLWSASEALSVTSPRGVIVAGPASPAQIVGGLLEVLGASL